MPLPPPSRTVKKVGLGQRHILSSGYLKKVKLWLESISLHLTCCVSPLQLLAARSSVSATPTHRNGMEALCGAVQEIALDALPRKCLELWIPPRFR